MEDRTRESWAGQMLDVEGTRARVELELDREGDMPQGEVRLTLLTEDVREETKGRATRGGGQEGEEVRLTFELGGEATVEVVGRRVPLERHAQAAIYGTYRARGGAASLSAGVVVLWHYAARR